MILSLIQKVREHYILVSIIVFGFFLRVYGIYFDYPAVEIVTAETWNMSYLLRVLQGDVFNNVLQYPALLSFLYIPGVLIKIAYIAVVRGLYGIDTLKAYFIVNGMGDLVVVARWYAVFFGTATIFLIYKIYRIVFKQEPPALYAALVCAVSLMPVLVSHWGKAHSGLIFFLVLSLYCILRFEEEKKLLWFWCSVITAALSFSAHYLGVNAFFIPLWGYVWNRESIKFRTVFKAALAYGAIVAFFYLVNYRGVFYSLYITLISPTSYYGSNNYTSIYPIGRWERFYYVIRESFNLEPAFVGLFLGLLVFNIKKFFKDRFVRYIAVFLACNYLFLTLVVASKYMSRYETPFILFSSTLAAAIAMEWLLKKGFGKFALCAIGTLFLIPSLIFTAKWLILIHNDTMVAAREHRSYPAAKGDVIYSTNNLIDVPLSYDAALWQRDMNGVTASGKINYIISHKEQFQNSGINIFYDRALRRKELAGPATKYAVVTYWNSDDGVTKVEKIKKEHTLELVQKFYPTDRKDLPLGEIEEGYVNNPLNWRVLMQLRGTGPFVEIYRVISYDKSSIQQLAYD